ncbi:MAG: hypothetical protein ACO1Q7_07090 [Gemmatimonas sp.]
MLVTAIPVLRRILRTIVGWLDDRGQAPIMHQHINDGTHAFRADEDEYRGLTGADEILGLGGVPPGYSGGNRDAHVSSDTAVRDLRAQYVAASKRTLAFALVTLVSILALLGLIGIGPMSAFAQLFAGFDRSLVIGAGVVAGLSCWRVGQSAVHAARLDRRLRQLKP